MFICDNSLSEFRGTYHLGGGEGGRVNIQRSIVYLECFYFLYIQIGS